MNYRTYTEQWQIPRRDFTTGTVREMLALKLQAKVNEIAQECKADHFFILIRALKVWVPNAHGKIVEGIKTDYKLLPRLPVDFPLINSMCIEIDRKEGKIEGRWVLPKIDPTLDIPTTLERTVDDVLDSVTKLKRGVKEFDYAKGF